MLSYRLGTNRTGGARFYPYGEEIGTATANDRTKFGTYNRDGFTGLDYADQRYYASSYGRFNTPDPYRASAGPSDPGSWNRYAYVGGDPVNSLDPTGLFSEGNGDDAGCSYNGQWIPGRDIGGPTQFAPVTALVGAGSGCIARRTRSQIERLSRHSASKILAR